ncbi:predicted protein [Streptomyces iranensis]|uniref:Uncharacterized protein n=1 Tax=Streptomyces iranensis TaxID=576784 RepID=A0A060ZQE3_9ACTN|nr:predicted protein [Streptomyces iranensis]
MSAQPKTRYSCRTIPLPPFVLDALRERREQQRAEHGSYGAEWLGTCTGSSRRP